MKGILKEIFNKFRPVMYKPTKQLSEILEKNKKYYVKIKQGLGVKSKRYDGLVYTWLINDITDKVIVIKLLTHKDGSVYKTEELEKSYIDTNYELIEIIN